MTAEQVTNQLVVQIPSAKLVTVFNAETDPNKLLGRPNGYLSKTLFGDRRILNGGHDKDQGGTVEVFADEDGATKRREHVEAIAKAAPILGSEYDYQSGPILVRVSHLLSPDQANEYRVALDNIADGKVPTPPVSPPALSVPAIPPPQSGPVTVGSVHDAATVVLTDGTRLRQLGISAPNTDTCQAKQATATTDTEVRRGPLTYQVLGQADVYGNQWAYIQVGGADFGEKLASLGWVWAYPDSPAPQEYNQRITNQVEAARAAHAGMFGTVCPTAATPPLPPPVVIPTEPGDAPTVAQLGQIISYPDGLTVSVATPERHLVSSSAAPSQFRKTKALLVTTTVRNTGQAPITFSPGSGPTVTYNGQEAPRVFDSEFSSSSETAVLPGKSFTYRYMYGVAEPAGELQVQVTREYGSSPGVFTGQG